MRKIEFYLPVRGKEKAFVRSVPEKWNELGTKQLLTCIRCLFTPGLTKHLRQRLLLQTLLQLPVAVFNALQPEQILALAPVTNFLTETNSLTRQLIPSFRIPYKPWRRLYGPHDYLRNVSFAEFIFADTYYTHFCQTGDELLLNKMVATLYRPKRWFNGLKNIFGFYFGDVRATFNEHLIAGRTKHVAKINDTRKLAIMAFYRGCREQMEAEYSYVFTAEKGERTNSSTGWEPVLRGMSGGKFGDIEKTMQIPIHTVLAEMNEQLQEAAKAKVKAEF
jgi:hypothetical protein